MTDRLSGGAWSGLPSRKISVKTALRPEQLETLAAGTKSIRDWHHTSDRLDWERGRCGKRKGARQWASLKERERVHPWPSQPVRLYQGESHRRLSEATETNIGTVLKAVLGELLSERIYRGPFLPSAYIPSLNWLNWTSSARTAAEITAFAEPFPQPRRRWLWSGYSVKTSFRNDLDSGWSDGLFRTIFTQFLDTCEPVWPSRVRR